MIILRIILIDAAKKRHHSPPEPHALLLLFPPNFRAQKNFAALSISTKIALGHSFE